MDLLAFRLETFHWKHLTMRSNSYQILMYESSRIADGQEAIETHGKYRDEVYKALDEMGMPFDIIQLIVDNFPRYKIYSNLYGSIVHYHKDDDLLVWNNEDFSEMIVPDVQRKLTTNVNTMRINTTRINTIHMTEGAFTVLLNDGSVVSWGDKDSGGMIPDKTKEQMKGKVIKKVYSNMCSFAALSEDGKVFAWGEKLRGGDTVLVKDQIDQNVIVEIYPSDYMFTALTKDQGVITWGYHRCSTTVKPEIQEELTDIVAIYPVQWGFFALKNNGMMTMVDTLNAMFNFYNVRPIIQRHIRNGNTIVNIHPTTKGFIFLMMDGTGILWERELIALNEVLFPSKVKHFADVKEVCINDITFVVLKNDGTVLSYGDIIFGKLSDMEDKDAEEKKVVGLYPMGESFIVLSDDHSLTVWGDEDNALDLETEQRICKNNVDMIACGNDVVFANLIDGTIRGWEFYSYSA